MLHPQSNNQVVNTESVLKFKTKMEFDKTFESNVLDSKYKLLKNLQNSSYNYENIQGLRGLSKETIENLNLENLVPDIQIARLLNPKGEIIISDTVYRVTPFGTFFTNVENYSKLDSLINSYDFNKETKVEDDIYIFDKLKRVDTYKNKFTYENISSSRGVNSDNISDDIIDSFEEVRASKHTIVGRWFESIGIGKTLTKNLYNNNDRRLNCEVFDYNFGFRASIGITAKIQKKMWYGGWGKVVNWDANTLSIGLKFAIIRYEYPIHPNDYFKKMEGMINKAWSMGDYSANFKDKIIKDNQLPPYMKHVLLDLKINNLQLVKITAEDLYRQCMSRLVQFWKSQKGELDTSKHYMDLYGYDNFSNYDVNQAIEYCTKYNKILPIYAEDGIYVIYPSLKINNREDQVEMTYRFTDDPSGSFVIGMSSNLTGFSSIKPTFNFKIETKATLVKGMFYASGYSNGKWVGYRLHW